MATENGADTEWVITPVCVPPSAVTTHCLALMFGGVSAVIVYVGEVNPVWACPVMGLVIEKVIMDNFQFRVVQTGLAANA